MKIIQKTSVIVSFIVMVSVNALAVLLPLNNKTTKELSDAIKMYFVPEGYVFSIWSLIYLAVLGYVIYQLLPSKAAQEKMHSIWWLFMINALANAGWIFLWHYEFVAASVILMVVILVTLIAIYLQLGIGRIQVSRTQYWLSHFPFSLYLGWISVATIANVAVALTVHQWTGWGIAPQYWSAIMIAVAALLALAMLWRRRDYVYSAVIIWALVGIALKFQAESVILWTAVIASSVIGLTAVTYATLTPKVSTST